MATLHAPTHRPLPLLPTPPNRHPLSYATFAGAGPDPLEQMARDDREDWALLRLVLCVSVATVLMAVASSFLA